MNIEEFVRLSIGSWRSQRSGHNLAFQHFEEVRSTIEIVALELDDPATIELCESYGIELSQATHPFGMNWRGESDWDDDETIEGSCILVPVPDRDRPNSGKLLRSQGYAETMAAAGEYRLGEDGTFVLETQYDRAAAEERIWFANPNLRFRVSLIKTSNGEGVLTASFASEIRMTVSENREKVETETDRISTASS
ncbi:phycobiliprotein lyase [Oscillatoriales cyanobacterium LEGE 11467]|uniref:Chromophore lyase CpcS/CpeS n=1 Tax=Zarconia navalis LEGE 11467 TaxID=1828826 RepID=A0A928Z9L7_9CYAN|nr:phycobiliprotein lyase [Zarconia navalis]MBE9041813.1 phycobiliprotein lyase [Zarconia navalis LEGE 11467]